ncbi:MAG: hypothetical protein AAF772_18025 [Acidobacteriota bacterium]
MRSQDDTKPRAVPDARAADAEQPALSEWGLEWHDVERIRAKLALTPTERLLTFQDFMNRVLAIREQNGISTSLESTLVNDRDRVATERRTPSPDGSEMRSTEPPASLPVSDWASIEDALAQDREER